VWRGCGERVGYSEDSDWGYLIAIKRAVGARDVAAPNQLEDVLLHQPDDEHQLDDGELQASRERVR
jgi:hypothetical protein